MIEQFRKGTCVVAAIGAMLCFVLLAATGSLPYFVAMLALGWFANWVYPKKRKRRS